MLFKDLAFLFKRFLLMLVCRWKWNVHQFDWDADANKTADDFCCLECGTRFGDQHR